MEHDTGALGSQEFAMCDERAHVCMVGARSRALQSCAAAVARAGVDTKMKNCAQSKRMRKEIRAAR